MSKLPASNRSLLVRTDFSDETAWRAMLAVVSTETADGFRAYVEIVDDERWREATPDALRNTGHARPSAAVRFVCDRITLSDPELPVLVVDLWGDHSPFRCVASELWVPDNNLNLANMDFHEFADNVGSDGIFRGFPSETSDSS